jgi:hypothetical protein
MSEAHDPDREERGTEDAAPPIPDDPRVPRLEDQEPTASHDLGGAAPAVGGDRD